MAKNQKNQGFAAIRDVVSSSRFRESRLNEKVTILENRPANETKKRIDGITEKLLWLIIGGVAVGLLATILPNIPW